MSKTSGLALASMIFGIASLLFSFVPLIGLVSIPFALLGLGLGVAGISVTRNGFAGRGLAITGVVTSIVALLVSLAWLTLIRAGTNEASDRVYAMAEQYGPAPPGSYAITIDECVVTEPGPRFRGTITNLSGVRRSFAATVNFKSQAGEFLEAASVESPSISPRESGLMTLSFPFAPDDAPGLPAICELSNVNFDGE